MNTSNRRSDWLVPLTLIALTLVPAMAGVARLTQLASGTNITPENARFIAAPLPVTIHITAAVVYGMLGAFQFSPGFRRRRPSWHRAAGRILIPLALLVAVSGLWMTLTYPWAIGDGLTLFIERLVFGSAMFAAVTLGVDAIYRRAFAEHGAWMMRAYAIAMGAGTQVFTHIPWFMVSDVKPSGAPRAIMMGLGWVINVAVAEWIIRKPAVHARTTLVPAQA